MIDVQTTRCSLYHCCVCLKYAGICEHNTAQAIRRAKEACGDCRMYAYLRQEFRREGSMDGLAGFVGLFPDEAPAVLDRAIDRRTRQKDRCGTTSRLLDIVPSRTFR